MAKKPKTCRAVHANRGIEAAYRAALRKMIDEMSASAEYWLRAEYRKSPPRMAALVAEDAAPNTASQRITYELAVMAKRWIERFNSHAPKLAQAYVTKMFTSSDVAFKAALKDAGWAVEFTMTPAVRDAFQASIAENVALIRSIPQQYFSQIEGVTMRAYSAGRDLESFVSDIKALYPAASHRAELIARDQSNKANAVVSRARQLELGITEAIWMHSRAGKTPRPDHVAADGKRYKIAEGCEISGRHIQPGTEINCRCTSRPILPI